MAQKTSPSASRTIKLGSPNSPDSATSKTSKPLDRKPSSKAAALPEKQLVRVSEMQRQLGQVQGELTKAKEEKSRALEELNEMKKALAQRSESEGSSKSTGKIKMLEREVEKANESERKMLESLVSQTKQLEETKISLEEAKLEIRTLQESIKGLEDSVGRSSRNLEKHPEKPKALDSVHPQEELGRVRMELKLAMEAEEKSKKAMDGLALALKEVTTEMNQVKEKLSETESELKTTMAEADCLKATLKSTEENFQMLLGEVKRLKLEADKSVAAWNEKENGFVNCMKVSEEETTKLKQENSRLMDNQRVAREENSKLRDIMKQAVNEATVVKESLEIARSENSQLKDLLSDKDNSIKTIKQEYECLKVSEAAATNSVKELKNLLAATSASDSSKIAGSIETGSLTKPKATDKEVIEGKIAAKFPSERWRSDNPRIQNGLRVPMVRSGSFQGSMFDRVGSPEQKDHMFTSLSSVSDLKAPSSLAMDDEETVNFDDFDRIDRIHLDGMDNELGSPTKHKKKPILRRFGEILRRRSFHK